MFEPQFVHEPLPQGRSALFHEFGDLHGIAYSLEGQARVALRESEVRNAVVLWGASEVLRERIGSQLPIREQTEQDLLVEKARSILAVLEESGFSAAWEEGRSLSIEQVVTRFT